VAVLPGSVGVGARVFAPAISAPIDVVVTLANTDTLTLVDGFTYT
jgi:hypothetical protein